VWVWVWEQGQVIQQQWPHVVEQQAVEGVGMQQGMGVLALVLR
jgi:hypothetical protein